MTKLSKILRTLIYLPTTVEKYKSSLPDIKVSEGLVFKRTKFRSGLGDEENKLWALWIPKALTTELIVKYHCSRNVGHPGINKTLARLREKYF